MHDHWDSKFGPRLSRIRIQRVLPSLEALRKDVLEINPHCAAKGPVLVVCDENTSSLARTIAGNEQNAYLEVLPPGEEHKTIQTVIRILEAALRHALSRDSLFIGVGGGVVCDMTAFAASLWMRGAPLALVPTSLLAMVDAAIGGKTGVDFGGLKNTVGTFRPADSVCIALAALDSLPLSQWKSGMAEVIKTAFIGDPLLVDILENCGPSPDGEICLEIVTRCARLKSRIVEQDPEETGSERAALNLGHTFGHALEAICQLGGISHGEGVAWGMSRANALALRLGIQSPESARRLDALLLRFGYETGPAHPAGLAATRGDANELARRLLAAMQGDKKKKDGSLRFVLPEAQGVRLLRLEKTDDVLAVLGGAP